MKYSLQAAFVHLAAAGKRETSSGEVTLLLVAAAEFLTCLTEVRSLYTTH